MVITNQESLTNLGDRLDHLENFNKVVAARLDNLENINKVVAARIHRPDSQVMRIYQTRPSEKKLEQLVVVGMGFVLGYAVKCFIEKLK